MPEQALAPIPGGGVPVRPARIIPPLPPDIPILPGQLKTARTARRLPVGLIIFLVLLGLGALGWLNVWYSDYDSKRIDPVVARALVAHVPKGTRLPVMLWSGPRILVIKLAFPNNQTGPGQTPTTCVTLDVLDPNTGAKDTSAKYRAGAATCIEGVAVTIR
jgi:hypothetical protein